MQRNNEHDSEMGNHLEEISDEKLKEQVPGKSDICPSKRSVQTEDGGIRMESEYKFQGARPKQKSEDIIFFLR